MHLGGVAALFGLNPLEAAALAPDDAQYYAASLREAGRLYAEREQGFLDYLAARVAHQTTSGVADVVSQALKRIASWRR